jgi:hypothetical protein
MASVWDSRSRPESGHHEIEIERLEQAREWIGFRGTASTPPAPGRWGDGDNLSFDHEVASLCEPNGQRATVAKGELRHVVALSS